VALFPRCTFKLELSDRGVVVAGKRLDGVLQLEVAEPIPRAEQLVVQLRSRAWAGYGSGRSRSVLRRQMFGREMRLDMPRDPPLGTGTLRSEFGTEIPAWLPPHLEGPDCGIEHVIQMRLEVDWAIDPKQTVRPIVLMPPSRAACKPLTIRSPTGFHESIVLEVALESQIVSHDDRVQGHLALRSGFDARFDAVELSLTSLSTIVMGRGDVRRDVVSKARIFAERLRRGQTVPFELSGNTRAPPSFRTGFIDHDFVLAVSIDIPWAFDPSFDIPLTVLPPGSNTYGEADAVPVGGERLRQISAAMARVTGLEMARAAPTLVEGTVGPVRVCVADGPRDGSLGIDVDITFPNVELGLELRPVGLLDGFRDSSLLPEKLRDRYVLRLAPEKGRPKPPDDAIASFVGRLLAGVETATEIRLSDHHLGLHFVLGNDGEEYLVEVARFAVGRANDVCDAIARLPFPTELETSRRAWQATAAEQDGFLVPVGPSLHGLTFHARVATGDERIARATVTTEWKAGAAATRVHLDLRAVALTKQARADLAGPASDPRLREVRAVFPMIQAPTVEHAVLERPGATADPRSILPAVDLFVLWVLEMRGERRRELPYR